MFKHNGILLSGEKPSAQEMIDQKVNHLGYKHYREKAGISLQDAIRLSGIQNLKAIENGDKIFQDFNQLKELATIYKANPHDMLMHSYSLPDTIVPVKCSDIPGNGYLTRSQIKEYKTKGGETSLEAMEREFEEIKIKFQLEHELEEINILEEVVV